MNAVQRTAEESARGDALKRRPIDRNQEGKKKGDKREKKRELPLDRKRKDTKYRTRGWNFHRRTRDLRLDNKVKKGER